MATRFPRSALALYGLAIVFAAAAGVVALAPSDMMVPAVVLLGVSSASWLVGRKRLRGSMPSAWD